MGVYFIFGAIKYNYRFSIRWISTSSIYKSLAYLKKGYEYDENVQLYYETCSLTPSIIYSVPLKVIRILYYEVKFHADAT